MATNKIAFVREKFVEFVVVRVADQVVASDRESNRAIRSWTLKYRRPVVLLGAKQQRLVGRRDIVNFLSRLDLSRLQWRRVTTAA
jgi:hypothetical protein